MSESPHKVNIISICSHCCVLRLPPLPHDYQYYWKFLNFETTLHATHLLKLLNKMCKYKMDPASILEVTEQTPQTDDVKPIYPFNFVEAEGIIIKFIKIYYTYNPRDYSIVVSDITNRDKHGKVMYISAHINPHKSVANSSPLYKTRCPSVIYT